MRKIIYFVTLVLVSACLKRHEVIVSNSLQFPLSKIEALKLVELNLKNITMRSHLAIKDNLGRDVPSQLTDTNFDNVADELVIQVSIPAKSSVQYQISLAQNPPVADSTKRTYCRFAPERMDDFAWENDKVAFRTYGQTLQKLFEQKNPEGLISSGIDCWSKRVEYPIIDKWYKKGETSGSYHEDNGEGLDNFHVGLSRGCGGTAIRHKGIFIYSENYSEWKILANGPLRSIFKLKYKPVMVEGKTLTETKTFTIDLGDNFYRCDVQFDGDISLDTLAIGLTLHDNQGKTDGSSEGFVSYWEPIDDSEIGMGAWVDESNMAGFKKIDNAGKDLNHIWLFAFLKNNRCTYYSGFGWKKAGRFNSEKSWKEYIENQLVQLSNPLSVKFD